MQHDAEKRETDADADGEMETSGIGHAATGVPDQPGPGHADDTSADGDAGFATNGE